LSYTSIRNSLLIVSKTIAFVKCFFKKILNLKNVEKGGKNLKSKLPQLQQLFLANFCLIW